MATQAKRKKWQRRSKRKENKFRSLFGLSGGAARHRLRSKIIYEFFLLRDSNKCHRCNEPVIFEEYSIDHSESFWESTDPVKAFYNVSECYMSHLKCNFVHGSAVGKKALKETLRKKKQLQDAFGGE